MNIVIINSIREMQHLIENSGRRDNKAKDAAIYAQKKKTKNPNYQT